MPAHRRTHGLAAPVGARAGGDGPRTASERPEQPAERGADHDAPTSRSEVAGVLTHPLRWAYVHSGVVGSRSSSDGRDMAGGATRHRHHLCENAARVPARSALVRSPATHCDSAGDRLRRRTSGRRLLDERSPARNPVTMPGGARSRGVLGRSWRRPSPQPGARSLRDRPVTPPSMRAARSSGASPSTERVRARRNPGSMSPWWPASPRGHGKVAEAPRYLVAGGRTYEHPMGDHRIRTVAAGGSRWVGVVRISSAEQRHLRPSVGP